MWKHLHIYERTANNSHECLQYIHKRLKPFDFNASITYKGLFTPINFLIFAFFVRLLSYLRSFFPFCLALVYHNPSIICHNSENQANSSIASTSTSNSGVVLGKSLLNSRNGLVPSNRVKAIKAFIDCKIQLSLQQFLHPHLCRG